MTDFEVNQETEWTKAPKTPGVYAVKGYRLGDIATYELVEVIVAPDHACRYFEKGELITDFGTDRTFSRSDFREWKPVSEITWRDIRWKRLCNSPKVFA